MKLFMIFCAVAVAQAAPLENGEASLSPISTDVSPPAVDLKKEPIDDLKPEESRIQEAVKVEAPQDLKKDVEQDTKNAQATATAAGDQKEDVEKRFLLPGFGGYRGYHGAHGSYANVASVGHYGAFGGFGGAYGGGLGIPIGGLGVGPALGLPVPGTFYG